VTILVRPHILVYVSIKYYTLVFLGWGSKASKHWQVVNVDIVVQCPVTPVQSPGQHSTAE